MEDAPSGRDLLDAAVALASSPLEAGDDLAPFLLIERWGERQAEHFEPDALSEARVKFEDLARVAKAGEAFAFVYCGRIGQGEQAIVIERAVAGQAAPDVFVQRFRPRRGLLRGFKLAGEPSSAGTGGSIR